MAGITSGPTIRNRIERAALASAVPLALLSGARHAPDAEARKRVVLKTAFHQPAGHPIVELSKESLTRIEQGTEGRVKLGFYPGSALVPAAEMANGVDDGMAYVGICKAIIEAYEGGLDDVYAEALKRQGLREFRGRMATDGKPEVRQVRSQEARGRGAIDA